MRLRRLQNRHNFGFSFIDFIRVLLKTQEVFFFQFCVKSAQKRLLCFVLSETMSSRGIFLRTARPNKTTCPSVISQSAINRASIVVSRSKTRQTCLRGRKTSQESQAVEKGRLSMNCNKTRKLIQFVGKNCNYDGKFRKH